jgi:integrase/plasmid maintenance system antidote protein VapI
MAIMASVPESVGALIPVPVRTAPIIQVRPSNKEPRNITLGELCEVFLKSKHLQLSKGEIGHRFFDEALQPTCKRVCTFFGQNILVEDLGPADFTALRTSLPTTWGLSPIAHFLQTVRSMFRFAYDNDFIKNQIRLGTNFRQPPAKQQREIRNAKGLQMFEAEEVRVLLSAAPPVLQAMILLGVNCGFGNADCGRLPLSALDLERGWVNFPRPKTAIARRCPLWPETVQAIHRALIMRPKTVAKAEYDRLAFLTRRGRQWCDGDGSSPLGRKVERILKRVGIRRPSLGFYGLRRTFETIGGYTLDQIAVNAIMGHASKSDDMPAVYRQRIADERLTSVTDYVRHWLFPDVASNYFAKFRAIAASIYADWEQLPTLSPPDVNHALIRSGIKQCELARGIGFNPQWVNTLVRGRKPLSKDAQLRVRTYFQQLSQGQSPTPLPKKETPMFNFPHEVPLPEDAVRALGHHPMAATDLEVLTRCLAEFGVTQMKLAEWWGYKRQFYGKMRYGERPIPHNSANRLREMFGVPKVDLPLRNRKQQSEKRFVSAQAIREILRAERFDAADLESLLNHLRIGFRTRRFMVAAYLRISRCTLQKMAKGHKRVNVRVAMQKFCDGVLAETGGVE